MFNIYYNMSSSNENFLLQNIKSSINKECKDNLIYKIEESKIPNLAKLNSFSEKINIKCHKCNYVNLRPYECKNCYLLICQKCFLSSESKIFCKCENSVFNKIENNHFYLKIINQLLIECGNCKSFHKIENYESHLNDCIDKKSVKIEIINDKYEFLKGENMRINNLIQREALETNKKIDDLKSKVKNIEFLKIRKLEESKNIIEESEIKLIKIRELYENRMKDFIYFEKKYLKLNEDNHHISEENQKLENEIENFKIDITSFIQLCKQKQYENEHKKKEIISIESDLISIKNEIEISKKLNQKLEVMHHNEKLIDELKIKISEEKGFRHIIFTLILFLVGIISFYVFKVIGIIKKI